MDPMSSVEGTLGRRAHDGDPEVEPVGHTVRGVPILAYDEKNRPVFGYHPESGRPICAFPTKRGPCKNTSRMDNGRCSHPAHGGRRAKGIAHPNFKTGEYSKVMPPVHLREKWQALRDDPEIAHHKNSIALVDSMVQDVFDHYEQGGTPELWRRLWETCGKLQVARRARDRPKAAEFGEELGLIIERGMHQANRQAEAVALLEARRRHADSQLKRELADKHTWTYEEAAAFYVALGAACRKHCTEEQILAIERDLSAIAARSGVG